MSGRRAGGGGGGGGRGGGAWAGPLLDRDEFRLISTFWPEYFPDEVMPFTLARSLCYCFGFCGVVQITLVLHARLAVGANNRQQLPAGVANQSSPMILFSSFGFPLHLSAAPARVNQGADGAPENDPRLFAVGAFRDFFLRGADDDRGAVAFGDGGSGASIIPTIQPRSQPTPLLGSLFPLACNANPVPAKTGRLCFLDSRCRK